LVCLRVVVLRFGRDIAPHVSQNKRLAHFLNLSIKISPWTYCQPFSTTHISLSPDSLAFSYLTRLCNFSLSFNECYFIINLRKESFLFNSINLKDKFIFGTDFLL
jgi:hypothetical protein